MREYRYKINSDIDAYGDTQNVIHFKFGDCRKMYHFTREFEQAHPRFCEEYVKYWRHEKSLFTDPLSIVNYIEMFDLPVRLYSNYVDREFEDYQAVKEWLCEQYMGQSLQQNQLYKFDFSNYGYVGMDGETKAE